MSLLKKKEYKVITLTVEGMKCGMCETHVNDIIRKNFKIKGVKSSARKNTITITYENEIDLIKVAEVLHSFGYDVIL